MEITFLEFCYVGIFQVLTGKNLQVEIALNRVSNSWRKWFKMVGILCGASKFLECLLQRCFSWSASTTPWDRDHCPNKVGHLFSHLVDLVVSLVSS